MKRRMIAGMPAPSGLILSVLCLMCLSCTLPEVQLAEKLAAEADWDGAVSAYREALRKDPFNPELAKKFENAKERAAEVHYANGRKWLKASKIPEALQEFQLALGLAPGKSEHQVALADTLRLKDAQQALQDAKTLHSLGRLEEALANYERAIELNPDLVEAVHGITAIAQQQQAMQTIGESTEPVTLRFQNTRLKQVFEILARTADIDILFDKDVRDDLVTIFTRDTPFSEALNLILTTNQLFARRVAPNTLLIIPDTKQKREQYQDLKIRTFYLSTAKAKDIANMLRTILETKRVYVNEPLNTVVLRDEPAKIALAEHIIQANDRSDAEVLFDVEVLEVNRTKTRRFGLNFAKQAGAGIFPPNTTEFSNTAQTFTFRQLGNLGPSSYLFTFPSNVLIDFFKQESDAKTLAAPKLRVLNNQKASINIGDKQPILLSTTNVLPGQATTGSTPTTSTVTSIEFKDTGIKLSVEPTVHLNNTITLRLQIEVTRLGDRVVLQSNPEISQFRFGTRTADTALNLKDGETVVLAGLIQEEDRRTRDAVPGVDDVPLLGDLLSRSDTSKVTTEVILIITPRIARNMVPPDLAKQTLWSGTSKQFSTTPLFSLNPPGSPLTAENLDSTQGVGLPHQPQPSTPETLLPNHVTAPSPKVQDAPTSPGPSPDAKTLPAHLSFSPAAVSTKAGEEIELQLTGEDLPPIEKSRITVRYDPTIIQFVRATEGEFWRNNQVPPSLTVSAIPNLGQVVIQMGKAGRQAQGTGPLANLVFLAKTPGQATIEIQTPLLEGSGKKPVPVITQHGRIWVQ